MISFGSFQAQENITFEQALERAYQQNGTLKNSKLISDYQEKLKASYLNLPQLEITGAFGQIQGEETDNSFGISQGLVFQPFIQRENRCWMRNGRQALSIRTLQKLSLPKKSVMFLQNPGASGKEKVLEYISKLYTNFADKAGLRLKKEKPIS
jgi:cobalt-zinc-cadmium resistance protein CzcA